MTASTTTTLTEFLLREIAADEAVAEAAIDETRVESRASSTLVDGHYVTTRLENEIVDDGIWHTSDHASNDAQVYGVTMQVYDEGGHTREQALHIARNDPARVLATCKAHRAIVEEHGSREVASLDRETWGQPFLVCRRCHEGVRQVVAPCPTLRALASIWADHDSYDERWAL